MEQHKISKKKHLISLGMSERRGSMASDYYRWLSIDI